MFFWKMHNTVYCQLVVNKVSDLVWKMEGTALQRTATFQTVASYCILFLYSKYNICIKLKTNRHSAEGGGWQLWQRSPAFLPQVKPVLWDKAGRWNSTCFILRLVEHPHTHKHNLTLWLNLKQPTAIVCFLLSLSLCVFFSDPLSSISFLFMEAVSLIWHRFAILATPPFSLCGSVIVHKNWPGQSLEPMTFSLWGNSTNHCSCHKNL